MREFEETENGPSDLVMIQVEGGDVLLLGAQVEVICLAPLEAGASYKGGLQAKDARH